jgi:hypothetical protein
MSRVFTIMVLVVLVALLGIVTNVVKKASAPEKPTAEQIDAANKAQQEQAKKQMQEQEVQMRRQMMEQRKKAEEQRKVMEKQAKESRTAPRGSLTPGGMDISEDWHKRRMDGEEGIAKEQAAMEKTQKNATPPPQPSLAKPTAQIK